MFFHVTLSQGRSDSLIIESDNKISALNFFNTFSTAVVQSIKNIVYSKKHDINYTTKVNNKSTTYYKVEIFCKSKHYAKIFTLYDVMKSVTKQQLINDFKKLYIDNEPIEDVYNIIVFDSSEGVARSIDNLFQIVYEINSKTHTIELEALDYKTLIDFFRNNINGELVEIRKIVHKDKTVKKDDNDYIRYVTIKTYNSQNEISSFKLPKLNKNFNEESLEQSIKSTVLVKGKRINKLFLNYSF